jgi:hypothetical protein
MLNLVVFRLISRRRIMGDNRRYYPLMAAVATSVLIFCMIGFGTFMGWLPMPRSSSGSPVEYFMSRSDTAIHHAAAECVRCGAIESINSISMQSAPSGAEAYLGNDAEAAVMRRAYFRVAIRMDDGTHLIMHSNKQNFTVGQRVKVIGDEIMPNPDD